MAELAQHILNALMLGSTYALMGIGLTLIFGIMNVVNFTHGELYTFGAYMLFFFASMLGMNFLLGIFAAMAMAVVLGGLISRNRLHKTGNYNAIVST